MRAEVDAYIRASNAGSHATKKTTSCNKDNFDTLVAKRDKFDMRPSLAGACAVAPQAVAHSGKENPLLRPTEDGEFPDQPEKESASDDPQFNCSVAMINCAHAAHGEPITSVNERSSLAMAGGKSAERRPRAGTLHGPRAGLSILAERSDRHQGGKASAAGLESENITLNSALDENVISPLVFSPHDGSAGKGHGRISSDEHSAASAPGVAQLAASLDVPEKLQDASMALQFASPADQLVLQSTAADANAKASTRILTAIAKSVGFVFQSKGSAADHVVVTLSDMAQRRMQISISLVGAGASIEIAASLETARLIDDDHMALATKLSETIGRNVEVAVVTSGQGIKGTEAEQVLGNQLAASNDQSLGEREGRQRTTRGNEQKPDRQNLARQATSNSRSDRDRNRLL